MAIAQRHARPQQVYSAQQGMGRGGPSGLADVLEVLLDKGLVIDAFVRVSVVGIELLTIDARVVVASVDTYLRFAEAVNRLDLLQANNSQQLGDLFGSGSSGSSGNGRTSAMSGGGESSEDEKEDRDGEVSETAPEDSKADDRPEGNRDAGAGGARTQDDDDRDDGARDEKGLLSRIKERGQVF